MPREKPVLKCYNPKIKQTKMWHDFLATDGIQQQQKRHDLVLMQEHSPGTVTLDSQKKKSIPNMQLDCLAGNNIYRVIIM